MNHRVRYWAQNCLILFIAALLAMGEAYSYTQVARAVSAKIKQVITTAGEPQGKGRGKKKPPQPPPSTSGMPELPRSRFMPAYPNTTGYTTLSPTTAAQLQTDIDTAAAGSGGYIIELDPAMAYASTNSIFEIKTRADTTNWIIIRTADTAFRPGGAVPFGVRVSPANAGDMPDISTDRNNSSTSPAIRTAESGNLGSIQKYWFEGLEIFSTAANGGNIITIGAGLSEHDTAEELPKDIVFDRCLIYGAPDKGIVRGIATYTRDICIRECYIYDIKTLGADTQAIQGHNGPGPFTIVNNYLEAAGENVMYGGANPQTEAVHPADLTFIGNYCSKPPEWQSGPVDPPSSPSAALQTGGSLSIGQQYFYRVVAVGDYANITDTWLSRPSTEVSATPTSGNQTIRISWTAPSETGFTIDGYRVYRGTSSLNQTLYMTTAAGVTTLDDTGALSETTSNIDKWGTRWTVKNVFEIKCMKRAQIEGNVFEYSWVGGQEGSVVVLKVTNQAANEAGRFITTHDLTIRNNVIRHGANAFSFGARENAFTDNPMTRVLIENNLIYDISKVTWGDNVNLGGRLFYAGYGGIDPWRSDIKIIHNTMLIDKDASFFSSSPTGAKMDGLVIRDNVIQYNNSDPEFVSGFRGDGGSYNGSAFVNYVNEPFTFSHNVIYDTPASKIPSSPTTGTFNVSARDYRTGNFFPSTRAAVRFQGHYVNNFLLKADSPYKGAASDGSDPGVNFAQLEAAMLMDLTPTDGSAPVISSVNHGTPGDTVATITWSTDDDSESRVFYDTTSRPGDTDGSQYTSSTSLAVEEVTAHSVGLTSLSASTTYFYKVRSANPFGGVSFSSEGSFTTAAGASDFLTDTFTVGSDTALASYTGGETGHTYSIGSGQSAGMTVDAANDSVYHTASTNYYSSPVPPSNTQKVTINFVYRSTVATQVFGATWKHQTDANTHYGIRINADSGLFQYFRRDAGTFNQLATYTPSGGFVNGTTYVVVVDVSQDGDSVDVSIKVDGVERITHQDTSANRITTVGRVGLAGGGAASTSTTGIHITSISAR